MMSHVSTTNFSEICRLCLQFQSNQNPLFPLFLHHGHYGRYVKDINESVPEMIAACIGLKVDPNDGLPVNICETCEGSLTKSLTFRNQCLSSNTYLVGLIDQPKTKTYDSEYDSEDNTPLRHVNPELVLCDVIKEEKPIINEEYMEYENYGDTQHYEELTIEPMPVLSRSATKSHSTKSLKLAKNVKTEKVTSPPEKKARKSGATPKHTITKPLIALKPNLMVTSTVTTATTTITAAETDTYTGELPGNQSDYKDFALQAYMQQNASDTSQPAGDMSLSMGEQSEPIGDGNQQQQKQPRKRSHKLPKQCNVCGLIVTRLRDHMKTHPEQLEFKCSHCPRTYLTKTGLDRHVDVQHADDRCGLNLTMKIKNEHDEATLPQPPPPFAIPATVNTESITDQSSTSIQKKSYAKPYLWQCNISKRLREMGHSYLDKAGRMREGRSMKPPCTEKCLFECKLNFNEAERYRIHKHYWTLTTHEKHIFLAQSVKRILPKRQRVTESRRQYTFLYHLELGNGRRLQVCKKFYMNTLDIREKKISWYFNNVHNYETGLPNFERKRASSKPKKEIK